MLDDAMYLHTSSNADNVAIPKRGPHTHRTQHTLGRNIKHGTYMSRVWIASLVHTIYTMHTVG